MREEFASVGGYQAEPDFIVKLEKSGVTFTGLQKDAKENSQWRTYFESSPAWARHLDAPSPLEDLYSGAYTTLHCYPLNQSNTDKYEKMLKDLRIRGNTSTFFIPVPPMFQDNS